MRGHSHLEPQGILFAGQLPPRQPGDCRYRFLVEGGSEFTVNVDASLIKAIEAKAMEVEQLVIKRAPSLAIAAVDGSVQLGLRDVEFLVAGS